MTPSLTPCEHARLMQTARQHAHALREQAINDLWQRAGLALRTGLHAASRLERSLAGHDQSGKKQGV
ncbi:MAG: hypothetical protein H0W47_16815 [Polaromonas sp.]|uniref:hypothetical protein n=1 Tax=Polaromonas sp. TaxID=1869339 RepID=UPI0017A5CAF2|nr:hypothetical protein [Polaromonas sp.]MBA3595429.1 hypothetical protein [Polaromonas sp.]